MFSIGDEVTILENAPGTFTDSQVGLTGIVLENRGSSIFVKFEDLYMDSDLKAYYGFYYLPRQIKLTEVEDYEICLT